MAVTTKILTLPPGDVGPVCSYSPICSPPAVQTTVWHEQTITIVENPIDLTEANSERRAMEDWVTQLVERELTGDLQAAQRQTDLQFRITLDDAAAYLIKTALEMRMSRSR